MQQNMPAAKKAHIAALDVGTTTVRCFILDDQCVIKGAATEPVELLNPKPGYFEIEPELLWRKIVKVVKEATKNAALVPAELTCLTLSTQRCTFLTWNHKTKEYFHNFITWKDLRADAMVQRWNSGWMLKTLNTFSYVLYLVTRCKRFLAGSVIKMMNGQITLRLMHEIMYNARLQQSIKNGEARVELLDSWILYKLRSGDGREPSVEHISDITSATATGIFDPFTLKWSTVMATMTGLNLQLLPRVVDNSYANFGFTHAAAFGEDEQWRDVEIPIASSVSDQTAAMWGSQCFERGNVKCTMGTGAFLNLMTGRSCTASIMGMYPLVAWQLRDNKTFHTLYCMEGASHDFGTVIQWAQTCGLFNNPAETSDIAQSVADTNDVFFMPAFSGLGPPVNDYKAASGFIGMTPSTTKAHMVRALLESIVFRLVQLCETMEQETNYEFDVLRVDGGVSRNDFICQFLADASGIKVERAKNSESSIMGATFLAGINHGIWNNVNDLKRFRVIDRIFLPRVKFYDSIRQRIEKWNRAIERFGDWY